jgi:hypothetical protein
VKSSQISTGRKRAIHRHRLKVNKSAAIGVGIIAGCAKGFSERYLWRENAGNISAGFSSIIKWLLVRTKYSQIKITQ